MQTANEIINCYYKFNYIYIVQGSTLRVAQLSGQVKCHFSQVNDIIILGVRGK